MNWMNWGVCRLIWLARGHNNKSAATALQAKFPGRRGLSGSSIQRNAALARKAPPDVIDILRKLPIQPKCEEGAEIVRLGLEAVERGPVVDPNELATSLKEKLPIAGPDTIADAVTAKMVGSGELVQKVVAGVAGVIAQQLDSSKVVADALAQTPKPPSADEVAAKVEATLAQHSKRIARHVGRYLARRIAKPPEPLNTKQLGDELAQKVSEKVPAPKVDDKKIAAAVVRGLVPWLGFGFAGLLVGVWIFLHLPSQDVSTKRVPGNDYVSEVDEEGWRRTLALGQGRLPLFEGQATPPCRKPEQEQDGGCWLALDEKPPCTEGRSYEKNGKCWVPVAERRKRPPQAGDGVRPPPPAQSPK